MKSILRNFVSLLRSFLFRSFYTFRNRRINWEALIAAIGLVLSVYVSYQNGKEAAVRDKENNEELKRIRKRDSVQLSILSEQYMENKKELRRIRTKDSVESSIKRNSDSLNISSANRDRQQTRKRDSTQVAFLSRQLSYLNDNLLTQRKTEGPYLNVEVSFPPDTVKQDRVVLNPIFKILNSGKSPTDVIVFNYIIVIPNENIVGDLDCKRMNDFTYGRPLLPNTFITTTGLGGLSIPVQTWSKIRNSSDNFPRPDYKLTPKEMNEKYEKEFKEYRDKRTKYDNHFRNYFLILNIKYSDKFGDDFSEIYQIYQISIPTLLENGRATSIYSGIINSGKEYLLKDCITNNNLNYSRFEKAIKRSLSSQRNIVY